MFFYILHYYVVPERDDFRGGRRNCATFLYGSFAYAVTYAILKNLRLRNGECFDAFVTALGMVFAADIAVMSYVYKSYYNRSIVAELGSEESDLWRFDKETHKYIRRPQEELERERLSREREFSLIHEKHQLELAELRQKLKEDHERRKDFAKVLEHKRRVAAARVIQRWWRHLLYMPEGRFYQRTQQHFYEQAAS